MFKKFNEQMVKENMPQAVDNPIYYAIWELGRKFQRQIFASKKSRIK